MFCFGKSGVMGADLLRYLRNIDKYFSDTMNPIEMQLPKLLIPPPPPPPKKKNTKMMGGEKRFF